MKNYFTIVLLLIVVLVASCAKRKKFDRIEATKDERYSIVYSLGKCGIYDNNADSLVTSIKYDNLKYSRGVVQDSIELQYGYVRRIVCLVWYPSLERIMKCWK